MNDMSMVLAVRYNSEELCSPESMKSWFEEKSCNVEKTKIHSGNQSFDWAHMDSVNTLMFVVDAQEDRDFPPILFDYVLSLENDDTIVSLAEECPSGFALIFEANLKRFVKELLTGE